MDNQNNGINLQKSQTINTPVETAEIYPNALTPTNVFSVPTPVENTSAPSPSVGTAVQNIPADNLKFCKFCGAKIPMDAVICTACGRQVEQLQGAANTVQQPQIVINNSNAANAAATAVAVPAGRRKSKWVCLALWFFLGLIGGHKFYEGKLGTGLIYMFTAGGFVIGWIVDLFGILNKPNPYYV